MTADKAGTASDQNFSHVTLRFLSISVKWRGNFPSYQFALKGKLSAALHKSTMLPYINTVMPPTERIRSTWQQPFPRTDSIPS